MDYGLIQIAGSLGVGALLGVIIFIMYRIDRKASEKNLQQLLDAEIRTREREAKKLTQLCSLLKEQNRYLIKGGNGK